MSSICFCTELSDPGHWPVKFFCSESGEVCHWQQLYGHLPPIFTIIQVRQTRHTGNCWRNKNKLISDVFLRTPSYAHASIGQPARTYLQQLCADSGWNLGERERERIREIHISGITWWWISWNYINIIM